MKIRENDVFVVTYPKCGTTWTQELVWQVANGVDIEKGGKVMLEERFPYLESESIWDMDALGMKGKVLTPMFGVMAWMSGFCWRQPRSWLGYNNLVEKLDHEDKNKRRFIKSHLLLSMLPENLGKSIFLQVNIFSS